MKKYWYLFVIIAIGLLSTVYGFSTKQNIQTPKPQVQQFKTMLTLDYGNGNANSYEINTKENATAFSILKSETEKQGIYLETQQYDFGVFVKKIGDLESGAKKSWIYYVNGVSGDKAADLYSLKESDTVLWKYETPKY
ncbi:MAG: hypothetical protein UR39_C0005G0033 [Candidatus Woesebacteria bacterium GW2011_GWA1_33_30]|uniref:Transcobalamin-like C-terminal domain-containing protein n=1 Tax=Candidatus Woesebacteria bacterium GW2011_GWA2_33_28 TaxID=1618561 RepID=A0A0G0C7K9_9BACT|nr:MAG: hypothetical protein UR38_C0005G0033 [Candidatus Woesebacteria bacterium GW2011_GWA2_33_28]KKP48151.1 MAG: hypothetical protein UR39_C0005G0033 [Candidatus Woesebacteria bacterium GW2011_GWA1_33_30]KKP49393.1 MAG: hypothetical protein UR40_C0006G0033 [Microgenomates group bacterium GW2011_GWC1_33_32]KKP52119.1 MAG: hypothetical protein UR44_C0004G0033 [Candidatus Woesebacteria bacterium GW2011_GWB1_33_38]KKP57594.1 MAG: hypothetical protein UR48_C0014G0023 [Microgenomates group bacteriu